MRLKFSVIDTPIVKVLTMDDRVQEFSFRQVFENAHLLQDISGDNALDRYAMFRLLLAFAMDMLELKSWRDRKILLEQGHFNMDVFERYVDECEKEGACFDILDQEHPFMQAAYDEKLDEKSLKSVANITHTEPAGTNKMFLNHTPETEQSMPIEKAFRSLVAYYLFCPQGGSGYMQGVNGTLPVYVMIKGDNLFESMVYNMLSEKELGNLPYGRGQVPWRCKDVLVPKKDYVSITLLEALTWQPRRVTLACRDDGLAKEIYFQPGKKFIQNNLWKDPAVPLVKNKDGNFAYLQPKHSRALWRDVGTLTIEKTDSVFRPPLILSQMPHFLSEERSICHVYVIGLIAKKASIEEYIEDEMSLPRFLFDDESKAEVFRETIDLCENVSSIICDSIKRCNRKIAGMTEKQLSDCERRTDDKHLLYLAQESETYFLTSLHDSLFGEFLWKLYSLDFETEDQVESYICAEREFLSVAVKSTIKNIIEKSGNSVKQLYCQQEIEQMIERRCKKLFEERKKKYDQ